MHTTQVTGPVLNWVTYLLNGAGHWLSQWDAVGHDPLLAVLTVVGCCWMCVELAVYAARCHRAAKAAGGGKAAEYQLLLRAVFIEMALINFIGGVVAWWCPPHYVLAALYLHNARLARRLNLCKLDQLEALECARASEAAPVQAPVGCVADAAGIAKLQAAACELNTMVQRRHRYGMGAGLAVGANGGGGHSDIQ